MEMYRKWRMCIVLHTPQLRLNIDLEVCRDAIRDPQSPAVWHVSRSKYWQLPKTSGSSKTSQQSFLNLDLKVRCDTNRNLSSNTAPHVITSKYWRRFKRSGICYVPLQLSSWRSRALQLCPDLKFLVLSLASSLRRLHDIHTVVFPNVTSVMFHSFVSRNSTL